jgi:uncharacterized membrane-anchored protein
MFSQTLGTALGDWMADTTGLGYEGGAIILTRPLGATVGDLLDKPHAHGGLALSRYTASAVIAAFIITCIMFVPQRGERQKAA